VDTQIEFIECPAHIDDEATLRCGLPAEILDRFNLWSTDGWLAAAVIVCPAKHRFSAPLDSLVAQRPTSVDHGGRYRAASRARCSGTWDRNGRVEGGVAR
jgi:hypothetical protein